jgi:carbonic anhydrase
MMKHDEEAKPANTNELSAGYAEGAKLVDENELSAGYEEKPWPEKWGELPDGYKMMDIYRELSHAYNEVADIMKQKASQLMTRYRLYNSTIMLSEKVDEKMFEYDPKAEIRDRNCLYELRSIYILGQQYKAKAWQMEEALETLKEDLDED